MAFSIKEIFFTYCFNLLNTIQLKLNCWLYFLFITLLIIIFSIARQNQTDVARICYRTSEKILRPVDSRSNFGWMIISNETRLVRYIRWLMWCSMCKIMNIITFLCCWVLLDLPRIAAHNRFLINPLYNDDLYSKTFLLERFIRKIDFTYVDNTPFFYADRIAWEKMVDGIKITKIK